MKLMKTEHIGVSVLMFLTLCPAAFPSPASSGQGLARDRGKGFTIALEAGLMRPADARFREILWRRGLCAGGQDLEGAGRRDIGVARRLRIQEGRDRARSRREDRSPQTFLSLGAALKTGR